MPTTYYTKDVIVIVPIPGVIERESIIDTSENSRRVKRTNLSDALLAVSSCNSYIDEYRVYRNNILIVRVRGVLDEPDMIDVWEKTSKSIHFERIPRQLFREIKQCIPTSE